MRRNLDEQREQAYHVIRPAQQSHTSNLLNVAGRSSENDIGCGATQGERGLDDRGPPMAHRAGLAGACRARHPSGARQRNI